MKRIVDTPVGQFELTYRVTRGSYSGLTLDVRARSTEPDFIFTINGKLYNRRMTIAPSWISLDGFEGLTDSAEAKLLSYLAPVAEEMRQDTAAIAAFLDEWLAEQLGYAQRQFDSELERIERRKAREIEEVKKLVAERKTQGWR